MITFDLNLAQFLSIPVLGATGAGLWWVKNKVLLHVDEKAQGIRDDVKALDSKVDGVVSTQVEQGAVLRTHGEDIAFLKGIQAGEAKIGQAANLVAAAMPHALEEKKP